MTQQLSPGINKGPWWTQLVAMINNAVANIASLLSSVASLQSSVTSLQSAVNADFGPGLAQNVVASSRVIGSVYQNTSNRPMFVVISCYADSGTGNATAYTDSNNPPTTAVESDSSENGLFYASLSFFVLPGNYYKVTSTTAFTILTWTEWN